jgi:hypothetical protein
VIYEHGETWWNDIDKVKLRNLEKNLSYCHFVHYKSYIGCLGLMPWPQ